jgi:hypothetical protein
MTLRETPINYVPELWEELLDHCKTAPPDVKTIKEWFIDRHI